MARWAPDGRGRLEQAAMELYLERGYDQTTVADIAERAGLTERTFFRHFTDKREVLFSGAGQLQAMLVESVRGAEHSMTPLDVIAGAFERAGAMFEERGTDPHRRQAVIDANPELQERELIKLAGLASALAEALRQRGVEEPGASLTAEAGIAIFRVAFDRWTHGEEGVELPELIRDSLARLRAAVAG